MGVGQAEGPRLPFRPPPPPYRYAVAWACPHPAGPGGALGKGWDFGQSWTMADEGGCSVWDTSVAPPRSVVVWGRCAVVRCAGEDLLMFGCFGGWALFAALPLPPPPPLSAWSPIQVIIT